MPTIDTPASVATISEYLARNASGVVASYKSLLYHTERSDPVWVNVQEKPIGFSDTPSLNYVPWIECRMNTFMLDYGSLTVTVGNHSSQTLTMTIFFVNQMDPGAHPPNEALRHLLGSGRGPWYGNLLVVTHADNEGFRDTVEDDMDAANECVLFVAKMFLIDGATMGVIL